jgi:hypothetical protein
MRPTFPTCDRLRSWSRLRSTDEPAVVSTPLDRRVAAPLDRRTRRGLDSARPTSRCSARPANSPWSRLRSTDESLLASTDEPLVGSTGHCAVGVGLAVAGGECQPGPPDRTEEHLRAHLSVPLHRVRARFRAVPELHRRRAHRLPRVRRTPAQGLQRGRRGLQGFGLLPQRQPQYVEHRRPDEDGDC